MDLRTGKIKWQYETQFPARVFPLITNRIYFVGYIPLSDANHARSTRSGIILALDKETGNKLWRYDLQAPIGRVGPSTMECYSCLQEA